MGAAKSSSRNARHEKPTGHRQQRSYWLDATRRRRPSSITRAPCRKVMGVPGRRSTAAR